MQQIVLPTTSAQRRLWLVERLTPRTSAYHIPLALRLSGRLEQAALHRSLRDLVERHEVLRTGFEELDGEIVQRVRPAAELPLPVHRTRPADLPQVLAKDAARPFDLRHGPLMRVALHRLGPDLHVLALTLHHLVADMWSIGVLLAELTRLYTAHTAGHTPALAELPVQYGDFAVWQEECLAPLEAGLSDYWRSALRGAPTLLDLPTDRVRPPVQSLRGCSVPVGLSDEDTTALLALCRAAGVTPFMVMLAALQAVLARYCGTDDIVVGTGVGTRPPEAEQLIGCFINILPVRTSLAGDPTFGELLTRVKQATLGALEHQELPFERIVEAAGTAPVLSHNPLVQALLLVQNAPLAAPSLPGLRVELVEVPRAGAQVDLNLQVWESNGRFAGHLDFAADLFDTSTVQRLAGHWTALLSAAVREPHTSLSGLPMLSADETRTALRQWNDTAAAFPEGDLCLHQLFERRCAEQPDAVAVVATDGPVSYTDLDARAERIAGRLRGLGVAPDQPVGVCLPRGPELAAAVLGVLKAGGAYLPLDPGYPSQRLAFMLDDAKPAIVLTDRRLADRVPTGSAEVLHVEDAGSWLGAPATAELSPDHLAYVIYTSGSTGRPKGIAVPHRGVVNNLLDLNTSHGIGPGDRVLGLSSPSFDMFVYEVLGILAAGGAVVMPRADRAKDPGHWLDLARTHRVTVWNSAPSLAEAFVRAAEQAAVRLPWLKVAFLGGDWIPVTLPERFGRVAPALAFIALGGATEASIHSIVHRVEAVDPAWASIPYGRPMLNQHAVVTHSGPGLAPAGVPGELCLGGIGLARGYLGRPGLTADRFRPHPFAGTPGVPAGARLYRTGDAARWRADGEIELIGRLDHQVKLRGLRIELGEVEAALRLHPRVARAVVAAQGAGDDRRLVAYVVAATDAPSPAELRAHLRTALPEHMVPAVFLNLDALPLSPNGKVDRARLPEPDADAVRAQGTAPFREPQTPLQRVLAALWGELLGLDLVGLDDNFFLLGGHSLLATRLASAVRETFGVEVPLRDLFEASTVAEQARRLTELGDRAGSDVAAIAAVAAELFELTDEEAQQLLLEQEGTDR